MADDEGLNNNTGCIKFYGLLYIDESHGEHLNLKGKKRSAEEYYVRCAASLANSAVKHGEDFTLITNSESRIREILQNNNMTPMEITGIDFVSRVPKGTRFFQAHHKLDVFKAFSSGRLGQRVGLLDLDMVFLRNFSHGLATEGIHIYDISSQVSAAGAAVQRTDLEKMLKGKQNVENETPPRWYGGEFIISQATEFSRLCDTIDDLFHNYIENISNLSHIGDETIVSAALNILGNTGIILHEHGAPGTISRWWSTRTGWEQPKFSEITDRAILHLPGDKPFLASVADVNADEQFLNLYQNYLRPRLLTRNLLNPFLNIMKGERKYASRL